MSFLLPSIHDEILTKAFAVFKALSREELEGAAESEIPRRLRPESQEEIDERREASEQMLADLRSGKTQQRGEGVPPPGHPEREKALEALRAMLAGKAMPIAPSPPSPPSKESPPWNVEDDEDEDEEGYELHPSEMAEEEPEGGMEDPREIKPVDIGRIKHSPQGRGWNIDHAGRRDPSHPRRMKAPLLGEFEGREEGGGLGEDYPLHGYEGKEMEMEEPPPEEDPLQELREKHAAMRSAPTKTPKDKYEGHKLREGLEQSLAGFYGGPRVEQETAREGIITPSSKGTGRQTGKTLVRDDEPTGAGPFKGISEADIPEPTPSPRRPSPPRSMTRVVPSRGRRRGPVDPDDQPPDES
jgi:hypothetical protein